MGHLNPLAITRRALLGASLAAPALVAQTRRPNVLVIITDDQGFGDLSIHGNPHLQTPHMDSIARQGAQLTQFHAGPVCAPTRASLMTGRYHYRTGVVDTYLGRAMMRPEEVTLPTVLAQAGYRTGIFGKWHLGDNAPLRPHERGFQESLVHKGGGLRQPSDPPGSGYFDPILERNGRAEKVSGYCTDAFTTAAVEFMTRHRDRPWFAYVATNAPHDPLEVDERYAAPFRAKGLDDREAKLYGMVANLDENVGRLLAALDQTGQREDTLVLFMTDNGPQSRRFNAGMRGLKGSVYQGGVRVPGFVRWPRRVKAGLEVRPIAAAIDVMPTILDACGVAPPKGVRMDGTSLLPLLTGQANAWPERTLFFQWHRGDEPEAFRNSAVRTQRHKLVDGKSLYDLESDPAEERDLAAAQPERVATMRAAYEAWFRDVGANGYAPPRIWIGSDRENPVTLTRQDWRGPRAGWNPDSLGHWEVEVRKAGRYAVTLTRTAPLDATQGLVRLGAADATVPWAAGAETCRLEVRLPTGPGRLEAMVGSGAASRGVQYADVRRL